MCPQIIDGNVEGDEDCLYLNVWRPLKKPAHLLPVMIWLHGGGNQSYSGAGSNGFGGVVYNGEKLVPQGVVFVSYNLRLGALGFLAHPALDAERPEKISGNYGSQDQIAMLNWVHRNIAAFGGDPSRVFVFGTSAGGGNICALLTSPLTRGLIHGVSMQSSVPTGCEIPTLADVEQRTGKTVVAKLGCDTSSDIAACLRSKSMKDVVDAFPGGPFSVFPRVYGPNMDGHVFVDQPLALIKQRKYPAVPIIIGNTAGETMHFIDAVGPVTDAASFAAGVAKVFGPRPGGRHRRPVSARRLPDASRRLREAHHRWRIHLPVEARRPHVRECPATAGIPLPLQSHTRKRPRAKGARPRAHRGASVPVQLAGQLPTHGDRPGSPTAHGRLLDSHGEDRQSQRPRRSGLACRVGDQ